MYRLILLFIIALLSTPQPAVSQEINTATVSGVSQTFLLSTPMGWVRDNESGVPQGLHAVFYPAGSSWNTSAVVMYARGIAKDDLTKTTKIQVEQTLKEFRENGSPDVSARFIKEITAEKGRKGSIYYFTGDKWNNYEAVAYFEEDKVIHFIVLSASTKDAFAAALKAFEELAQSYLFIPDNVGREKK